MKGHMPCCLPQIGIVCLLVQSQLTLSPSRESYPASPTDESQIDSLHLCSGEAVNSQQDLLILLSLRLPQPGEGEVPGSLDGSCSLRYPGI